MTGLHIFLTGAALLSADARQTTSGPAPQSQPAADWPLFRGDAANTGVAAGTLPDELRVLWKLEWKEPIESTATIVGDAVYVGCDDSHIYAVDLARGQVRWKYKAGDAIKASPTFARGVVYCGDEAGVMHAVDARSGAEKWRFATEGGIYSSVIPDGDRLYFGSYDGKLYCLSVADGKPLWTLQTGDKLHGTPALVDGNLLAAGCDGALHVVRAADGTQLREIKLGAVSGASVACFGGVAYLPTQGCQVLAIDWQSEKLVWLFEDKERQFPYQASVGVRDEWVVIGGRDKRVRGLDVRSGVQKWEFVTKGRIDGSAVIVGARVFVPGGDGNLYALELSSGRELWRFEAGGFVASPAVAQGRLVIGSIDGVLYCFGAR